MEYKYNIGDIVYYIEVNDILIIKVIRGKITDRWKDSDKKNVYTVIPEYQKIIKTYKIIKTFFSNPYQKSKYKDDCNVGETIKMSANEQSLVGRTLHLRDIKKALKRRKRQLKKQSESRPICYFSGKPVDYAGGNNNIMDGPSYYYPEGEKNIVYEKWPMTGFVDKDIYTAKITSGSFKEKNHKVEEYDMTIENGKFRLIEEVPNHRKLIAFNYWNGNKRYYTYDNVKIDEEKYYFLEFDIEETGKNTELINLSQICGVARLAKNKDYLYIKTLKFLRDNDGQLIKFRNGITAFNKLKTGSKINTKAMGTVSENGKVDKNFELIGLCLSETSSYSSIF